MIDSHQHFWRLAEPFTDWPTPDLAAIYRDFVPADLAPLLDRAGVTGTILVQAAPSIEETRSLLDLAETTPFVRGVVGWVDFGAPDAVAQLRSLAGNLLLKGLRPMIQAQREPGWILQFGFDPVFQAMLEFGLRFDALVRADQIGDIGRLAARYPTLPIVLDHAGKPDIAGDEFAGWADDIGQLATNPNVCCKLSGLWTEAGSDISASAISPYVTHLLDTFGPQRLIWGSDWPVVELAGSYTGWCDQARQLLAHSPEAQREQVFSGNAARFYGLDND